ncbi:hypothetical protein RHECNPAF_1340072 [Rhizobium etli CNPAF512]|nr:hypothetical protein RHECNPAF_1340072 [Rhizobium etli CNPAF512]
MSTVARDGRPLKFFSIGAPSLVLKSSDRQRRIIRWTRYRMAHLTANCPANEKFVMFCNVAGRHCARP